MRQSARFYGFFQNMHTGQPPRAHVEDRSCAVDEAYHLCEKVVSRLQTLDKEESYQLARRCKPLGFVFLDLPINPESFLRCSSTESHDYQGNHKSLYDRLTADSSMSESMWGTELSELTTQLGAEMASVDVFMGSSCRFNMASKNGPDCAYHNHDLKYPAHSVDSSGQHLPEAENGDPTSSPSGNCQTPVAVAVDLVLPSAAGDVADSESNSVQRMTGNDIIRDRSGQAGFGSENISPAMDILEGEADTAITSFGCRRLTSPSACSSSSEGSISVGSSTHQEWSGTLIPSLEDTAHAPVALATLCSPLVDSYQGYNISSPSNHCTNPVGEEMYAFDYPDIAVPGQFDGLADIDDRIPTLSSYSVARPCSPNAVPDVVPSERESIPMGDAYDSGSDIQTSSLQEHSAGTPGSPPQNQYSVCLDASGQSVTNSRLREVEWESQALDLMIRHYSTKLLKPGRLNSVISVSHTIIRTDLDEFMDHHVLLWQSQNPWSLRSRHQYSGNDSLRRLSLMRLFHYYDYLRTDSLPGLGRGRDKRTKALNFLLKLYYSDWEARPSLQQKRRERLKKNVDQGRRWCTLAQYLGYYVALSSSAEMDKFMNNKNVNEVDIHALATFAINVYPDGLELCSALDSIAVDILNRNNIRVDIDLGTWHNSYYLFSSTRDNRLRLSPSRWKEVSSNESCRLLGVLRADRV
ncbi:hypothetical protein CNMCM5878_005664 [Aspergillus fumigatiaffinis]|nr:hypothetical protein CNMCM5878_005664 [Aspergillus fumigatiaffinis]